MDREALQRIVQGALKREDPNEDVEPPAPSAAAETQEAVAEYAQGALRDARDPGMDPFVFDPNVLFPEE